MKTIIHLELSDSERSNLAAALGGTHPVTRKEVTKLVHDFIQEKVNAKAAAALGMPDTETNAEADKPLSEGTIKEAAEKIRGFVPSRGDEDYITRPADPGIAAACSRVLDDITLIEAFIWETIEKNRKP